VFIKGPVESSRVACSAGVTRFRALRARITLTYSFCPLRYFCPQHYFCPPHSSWRSDKPWQGSRRYRPITRANSSASSTSLSIDAYSSAQFSTPRPSSPPLTPDLAPSTPAPRGFLAPALRLMAANATPKSGMRITPNTSTKQPRTRQYGAIPAHRAARPPYTRSDRHYHLRSLLRNGPHQAHRRDPRPRGHPRLMAMVLQRRRKWRPRQG
jgi:hypothetical protein